MSIFSLLSKTIDLAPVAEVVESRCLRRRLSSFDCTLCVDNCVVNAVTHRQANGRGEIHIDNQKCTGCGRCTAVCPAEAIVFPDFDLYQALDECDTFEETLFTCHRQKQSFPKEFCVPCVGALSIEALLYVGLKGSGPVYFNLASCHGCSRHQVFEKFLALLDHAQRILTDEFANLIAITESSQLPDFSKKDRRSFLFDLGSNAVSLVKNQYGTPLQQKMSSQAASQAKGRRVPRKTLLLGKAINAKDNPAAANILARCVPTISLTDSCTLCPRCTGMCPTGALKVERRQDKSKKLSFAADKCTACGLCVAFCEMEAITVTYPLK
ncbi:MAG: 4Fe-4S dicluster domain-containing protein [Desulforhopalus sp.]